MSRLLAMKHGSSTSKITIQTVRNSCTRNSWMGLKCTSQRTTSEGTALQVNTIPILVGRAKLKMLVILPTWDRRFPSPFRAMRLLAHSLKQLSNLKTSLRLSSSLIRQTISLLLITRPRLLKLKRVKKVVNECFFFYGSKPS